MGPASLFLSLFTAGLCTVATAASPHILQSTTKARIPDDACTFRAYEIQVCNATAGLPLPYVTTYLQIDKVFAADGSISVDVAALRPRSSHNSYHRLNLDDVFGVATLKEGKVLSIELSESDGMRFTYGERGWSVNDAIVDDGRAWCEVADWRVGNEAWRCESGRDRRNRKRNLTCGFPCGKQEMTELR